MSALRYPLAARAIASLAGFWAFVAAGVIFRLPDGVLRRLFGLAAGALRRVRGDGPTARALGDLAFIFAKGGDGARTFRRILTRSSYEDIAGTVRGAVLGKMA